jgi:hypothetical protein
MITMVTRMGMKRGLWSTVFIRFTAEAQRRKDEIGFLCVSASLR